MYSGSQITKEVFNCATTPASTTAAFGSTIAPNASFETEDCLPLPKSPVLATRQTTV